MQQFEIHQASHRWKNCMDARPWLVVEVRSPHIVGCFPISGECYSGDCFELPKDHPDFAATGLSKSCFIHDQYIVELGTDEFLRRRGVLSGELLTAFRRFSGI